MVSHSYFRTSHATRRLARHLPMLFHFWLRGRPCPPVACVPGPPPAMFYAYFGDVDTRGGGTLSWYASGDAGVLSTAQALVASEPLDWVSALRAGGLTGVRVLRFILHINPASCVAASSIASA